MEYFDYIHIHTYDTHCKLNLQERKEKGILECMIVNFNNLFVLLPEATNISRFRTSLYFHSNTNYWLNIDRRYQINQKHFDSLKLLLWYFTGCWFFYRSNFEPTSSIFIETLYCPCWFFKTMIYPSERKTSCTYI